MGVKSLQIAIIATFIVAIFLSSGLVSALESNQATAIVAGLPAQVPKGTAVTVRVIFTSNVDEQIQIQAIGLHFDWMDQDQFAGPQFSTPVVVQANGTYTSDPIAVLVPDNVTYGEHSYFIGVDGLEGSSSTGFSWDSSTYTVVVNAGGNQTTTTTTPTPTSGGTPANSQDLLLYAAIIAVAVIIVVVVIVTLMRKKRKPPSPVAEQPLTNIEGSS